MGRRIAIALLALLAAALVALLLLPWWLPYAARPLAEKYGVTFDGYHRDGYGHFVLTGIVVQRPGVEIKVSQAECTTPLIWLLRHLSRQDVELVADHWSVTVVKRQPAPPTSGPSGWVLLRGTLQRLAATLDHWVPDAKVGPGSVSWPGGQLSLGGATWQARTLTVAKLSYRTLVANGRVAFARNSDDEIDVALTEAGNDGGATLTSHAHDVKGVIRWWGQPLNLDATFANDGWLPRRADIYADGVEIPGTRLKLAAAYTSVKGHAHIHWESGRLHADVAARGAPADPHSPPVDVTLRADGDTQSVTIAALHASIPGGEANLTEPLTIERTGRVRTSAAQFQVHADLAQFPWLHGTGIVNGDARVVVSGGVPAIEFKVGAEEVHLPGTELREAAVEARLAWPELSVTHAEIVGPTEGERATITGGWNFKTKTVAPTVISGKLTRAAIARWLPPSLGFEQATFDVHARGSGAIETRGRVRLENLRVAGLRTGKMDVSWSGAGEAISAFRVGFANADAQLEMAGRANFSGVVMTELNVREQGGAELHLGQPAELQWRPQLRLDRFHLAGGDVSIEASGSFGAAGAINVVVHGLSSRFVSAVYPLRGPVWSVPSFALQGKWDNGPMRYSAAGGFEFALPDGRSARVNLAVHGDEHATTIEALHGVERGNPVVNASGVLPAVVSPGTRPIIAVASDGPIKFDAVTVPDAVFWDQIAAMTGVELRAPQMDAHVTGTWSQPRGTVRLRLEQAVMDPKRFTRPLPKLDNVELAVAADAEGIHLEQLSLAVEGQALHVSGTLPVDRTNWQTLLRAPLPYVQAHAQLRLQIPDAHVAMFSPYLPAALAPSGSLQADIQFNRGALAGFLRLRDAASRPLGPLGVLQQVSADVDFADHRVILRRVSALSGGQPVTVSGTVELPASGWTTGTLTEPRYNIAVHGENLPFVRQAGMLIRGDLDLTLKTPDKGSPHISGKVTLRDSLFLTDVRAFLPHGGGASPAHRPPYFSVETAPLNTWVLDVNVVGTRFIRVRMPVFSGVASTHFHLGGTLGDPRAIGEATIDQGTVRMPFASFDVKQGAVRLTEESPYEPTIYLRGLGQHWGYDLTLEITGKASSPDIAFTSSPALDPEQVLLMVMTGAAPSNEVNSSLTHRAVAIGAFFGQSLMGSLTGSDGAQDKLSIESGAKVSEQGKETYDIEYKLSDRWTLTGEYDEFDQYIAGVKWRVAPKHKAR